MKLHHTKYKANYKKYILDTIHIEGNESPTDEEKIDYIFNRFNREYGWAVERIGKHKAMSEWLSGLALGLVFYNEDIIELAIRMGSVEENPTPRVESIVLKNYWDFMANIILGFEPTTEKV